MVLYNPNVIPVQYLLVPTCIPVVIVVRHRSEKVYVDNSRLFILGRFCTVACSWVSGPIEVLFSKHKQQLDYVHRTGILCTNLL